MADDNLRRRAELVAEGALPQDGQGAPDGARQLLHELRVHQLELEMQNDELRRTQADLEAARTRYFDLYDLAPVGYLTLSEPGLILEANLTAATLLGVVRSALVREPFSRFVLDADHDSYYRRRKELFRTGAPAAFDLRLKKQDGSPFWAHMRAANAPHRDGAPPVSHIAIVDVDAQKQLEAVQAFLANTISGTTSEPFFNALARYLAQHLGMDFVCIDRLEGDGLAAQTVAVWCDGRFEDNVTYALKDTPCGDVVGKTVCCFPASVCQFFPRDQVLQDLHAESYVGVTLFSHAGLPIGLIAVIGRRPLANRPLAEATLKMVAGRAAGELERLDAEAERLALESRLQQSQKMESVGRLAGGVAHDFNNMLGVILGHTEMALDQVDPSLPLHADLEEIRMAASRSADLTRQLLAFARKQTITLKVLDLNETVGGMLKMLQRLIGEDIDLVWRPAADPCPVKMDPSQVDQILANLCVNARDAVADVGTITIDTQNTVVGDGDCVGHPGWVPGAYVRIAVSDTGCGMNQETMSHVFEPFFTTKDTGKGTGLGLATVYGAVTQNRGFIHINSEPGRGTTFAVYLPRHTGKAEQLADAGASGTSSPAHETILLVEDEPAVLRLTASMLERLGYTVVAAGSPGEAIRLAAQHAGPLHVLMTDIVMPEMNGRDLARRILTLYPDITRVFMSGYTADLIADRGVLDEAVHFIQKPFTRHDLATRLREALGR